MSNGFDGTKRTWTHRVMLFATGWLLFVNTSFAQGVQT
jgi:hypothetical protein